MVNFTQTSHTSSSSSSPSLPASLSLSTSCSWTDDWADCNSSPACILCLACVKIDCEGDSLVSWENRTLWQGKVPLGRVGKKSNSPDGTHNRLFKKDGTVYRTVDFHSDFWRILVWDSPTLKLSYVEKSVFPGYSTAIILCCGLFMASLLLNTKNKRRKTEYRSENRRVA